MDPSTMLGPIDALSPFIHYIVFGLVILNMLTRHMQHSRHKQEIADDAETLTRHPAHVASNVGLILGTFYLLSIDYHGGIVLGTLVLGLIITDLFEFESRQVEYEENMPLEQPKAAIVASGIVFLYAFYLSLFFLIEPAWQAIF